MRFVGGQYGVTPSSSLKPGATYDKFVVFAKRPTVFSALRVARRILITAT